MDKDYERRFIWSVPFFLICLAITMFFTNGWLTTVLIGAVGILWGLYVFRWYKQNY